MNEGFFQERLDNLKFKKQILNNRLNEEDPLMIILNFMIDSGDFISTYVSNQSISVVDQLLNSFELVNVSLDLDSPRATPDILQGATNVQKILNDLIFDSTAKIYEDFRGNQILQNSSYQFQKYFYAGSYLLSDDDRDRRSLDSGASELKDLLENARASKNEAERLVKALTNEIDDLKRNYAEDLATLEIDRQASNFKSSAEGYKKEAIYWRFFFVGTLILFFILCFCFLNSCWEDKCNMLGQYSSHKSFLTILFYSDLGKNILIRFLILSIVIILIKYILKVMNALMHNYTVNVHKANSLQAALRIIESLANDTTREIVLSNAAKEIFNLQKTGFLAKDDNKIDVSIIEKIFSIFKSNGSSIEK